MKTDEIVKAIREQQLKTFEKRDYIDVLSENEIRNLLLEKNYFYIKRDNELLASCYIKPLVEKPKIYRLGGLSIKNSSFIARKASVELLKKTQNYLVKYNIAFVVQTDTASIESFLIDNGAKKISFEEGLVQYPLFIKAYIDDSVRSKEYFNSKIFYVREGNVL
ncbi:hypothetical protein MNB_SV-12-33 [hydrothermal vent metagenome]|uniref:N-acetyltransferase domain-containing protein n=1 Tax=hydrothermal vent metagenome TaxID=652676 RepID=A0A1W1BGS2_9ZZZZ